MADYLATKLLLCIIIIIIYIMYIIERKLFFVAFNFCKVCKIREFARLNPLQKYVALLYIELKFIMLSSIALQLLTPISGGSSLREYEEH